MQQQQQSNLQESALNQQQVNQSGVNGVINIQNQLQKKTGENNQTNNINNNNCNSQDIQQMLKNFVTLPCAIHKIRNYDHVCTQIQCTSSQTLFCSKCLIEDEKHTLQHKNNLQSIESYLPSKIEALSGAAPRTALLQMKSRVEQLQLGLGTCIQKTSDNIEKDFQEIQSNVIAFCTEIKKDLVQQVQNFGKSQGVVLNQFLQDIGSALVSLERESNEILKDFNDIITSENFDFSNHHMVNSFIRKVRAKNNNFSVDFFTKKGAEDIAAFAFDLVNNQYYRNQVTNDIKSTVYSALQNPYKEKKFLNFEKIPIIKTPAAAIETTLKTLDDKKSIVPADTKKGSIVQKVTLNCEHKQPINSIAVIDFNTFATSANDSKVKIWGFTPNFVIHERSSIDLGVDLCLCLKYWKEKALLFLALSHSKSIKVYDVGGDNIKSPNLVKNFLGHERAVRILSLLPQQEAFVSCSYDETIKFWRFSEDQSKPAFSYFINADARVLDANNKFTVCGCNDGTIKVFKNGFASFQQQLQTGGKVQEQQIQTGNNETSSNNTEFIKNQCKNSLDLVASVKASKDKITCVSLQQLNQDILFCGSATGSISMWTLSGQGGQPDKDGQQQQVENGKNDIVLLKKFSNWHKGRIFSLNVFERSQILSEDQQRDDQIKQQPGTFLESVGWDGMVNLIDVDNNKILSNTKFDLQNDEKKHWNTDGSRLIFRDEGLFYALTIGNDDKRVQIYEIKFTNLKQ